MAWVRAPNSTFDLTGPTPKNPGLAWTPPSIPSPAPTPSMTAAYQTLVNGFSNFAQSAPISG